MTSDSIEPLYAALGTRLQRVRRQRGLTQEQLGALLLPPATRASIANIEGGKQRVLVHTLLQLSMALDVNVTDLVDKDFLQPDPVAEELATKLHLPKTALQKLTAALREKP